MRPTSFSIFYLFFLFTRPVSEVEYHKFRSRTDRSITRTTPDVPLTVCTTAAGGVRAVSRSPPYPRHRGAILLRNSMIDEPLFTELRGTASRRRSFPPIEMYIVSIHYSRFDYYTPNSECSRGALLLSFCFFSTPTLRSAVAGGSGEGGAKQNQNRRHVITASRRLGQRFRCLSSFHGRHNVRCLNTLDGAQ